MLKKSHLNKRDARTIQEEIAIHENALRYRMIREETMTTIEWHRGYIQGMLFVAKLITKRVFR